MNNETMNNDTINDQTDPLKVILCGANMQFILKTVFMPFASQPKHFEVLLLVTELKTVEREVLNYRPDLLVIESSLAPSIDELQSCLTRIVNATPITVVLVLTEECPPITYQFSGVERVRLWLAPVSWTEVAESIYFFMSEQKSSLHEAVVEEARDLLWMADDEESDE